MFYIFRSDYNNIYVTDSFILNIRHLTKTLFRRYFYNAGIVMYLNVLIININNIEKHLLILIM